MREDKEISALKSEVQLLSLQQEVQRLRQSLVEIQADKEAQQARIDNLENSFVRVTLPQITAKIAETITVDNAVRVSGTVLEGTRSIFNAVTTTATPILQSLKESVKEGLRNPKRPKRQRAPAVRLYKHGNSSRAAESYL